MSEQKKECATCALAGDPKTVSAYDFSCPCCSARYFLAGLGRFGSSQHVAGIKQELLKLLRNEIERIEETQQEVPPEVCCDATDRVCTAEHWPD